MLWVLVTATNVLEQTAVKCLLKRIKQMGTKAERLYLVWADGDNGGKPFLR
jgi:hypothetical protein